MATAEKKLYSLADYLHECATVHGVAEIELANHQLMAKMYSTDCEFYVLHTETNMKINLCQPCI